MSQEGPRQPDVHMQSSPSRQLPFTRKIIKFRLDLIELNSYLLYAKVFNLYSQYL